MQNENVSRLFFEVGELVQYVSFYGDDTTGWISKGDFGIVIAVRDLHEHHQIVKVRWFSDGSAIDMASDCLVKITVSGSAVITKDNYLKEKK